MVLQMQVEDDMNVQDDDQVRDEFTAVVSAFEYVTGLQAVFRPMSNRWDAITGPDIRESPFTYHRSDFCNTMKWRDLPACTRSDNQEVIAACTSPSPARRRPFVRTCHAGAAEIIIPLWSGAVLVGVIFLGQFKGSGSPARGLPELRQLSGEQIRHFVRLTEPLQRFVLDVLRRLDSGGAAPRTSRRGEIEDYIRSSLAGRPSLSDLSTRLNLSPTRTSHVVREETGSSFSELVRQQRVVLACDLLTRTDSTVKAIAAQVGFNDTAYFSRYFKEKVGKTPTDYRHEHSRDVAV